MAHSLNAGVSAVFPARQVLQDRRRTEPIIKPTAKDKINELMAFIQAAEPEFELMHTAQVIQQATLRIQRQIGPVAPPLRGRFDGAGS